ncbi:non-ribosomal peptide synthetase [Streptomyces sp. URMC 123]|uniref:non-ribosomal peptide synthetase n=1 Tax=Streptomyces sp. URMC 123 TaxID=3423403 RepID=UPI003F1B7930
MTRIEDTEDRTGPELAARRRELQRLLLTEAGLRGPDDTSFDPIRTGAGPGTAAAPLSSAERRMWFLHRLRPDGAAYNLCGGVRLTGELDEAALAAAVASLVEEHDVLRTVYPAEEDGSPVRRVQPPAGPALTAEPAHAPGPRRADAARELIEREGARPFALDREPPARFRLFRFAPGDHLLVFTVHHIAFDDLAWGQVLGELAERYERARSTGAGDGPAAAPRPAAVRYADFARWENARLASGAWDGQLDYWRGRLSPPPPLPALPADRPRPGPAGDASTTAGVRRDARLGEDDTRALRALAKEAGVTLYTVLLAAYQVLLHRWTGESDIAIGSPVVNRGRAEFENVVGNFGNTVVLRTDLGGDPVFRDLLARTRDTCVDAFAHQDVPFDRVTEALRPADAVGQAPLFDAVFSYVAAPPRRIATAGLVFEEVPHHNGTARFPLVVEGREGPDGIALGLTARADLFTPEAVERMLGHLVTVVCGAARDPGLRLSRLPVLTAAEERRTLTEWSRTTDDPAVDRPLHRLVEEQAERTPDLVAVVAGDTTLTYRELDRRAGLLAHRLRALGVGPERVVGLHLVRSPELVVGLLAVLKAGGAFMPLEPAWPELRRAAVARGARPVLVLTDGRRTEAPPPLDAPVLDLAEAEAGAETGYEAVPGARAYESASGADAYESAPGARAYVADPGARVDMENLAYVIHTSGSTGTPKGVMIRHQAIANRLVWQSRLLGMTTADAVLHKAPMGFDISVNEIFLPLVNGARLVLADPRAQGDVGHLAEVIVRERVTFLYIVASMLDVLLERDDIAAVGRSLRHLWCGGEALTPELYRRFRARLGATLYHGYGPAEATIGVSCKVFEERAGDAAVTIGRPNPNTRIHLLDAALRPVPVGVPGELYIGGMPLARGYLGDPRRTAESFVPDPFGGERGGRLYRTGDLARYRSDGQIEFLGRVDNQVKVRGFRIELEEVEAALAAHPAVRQAAVLVRTGGPGGDRLAAWCVPQGAVTPGELRDWVAARLPHYCVPGTVELLERLPLTAAGKADRAALLARPAVEQGGPGTPFVRPGSALERDIAAIWSELLGRDDVGARHNFFDLGGHSLLLVKAQTLYRRRLGREVPLVELYDHPTVAALAGLLSRGPGAGSEAGSELDRARERALRQRQMTARRGPGPRPGRAAHPHAGDPRPGDQRAADQWADTPGERTR